MKKVFAFMAAALVAFSFASCNGNNPSLGKNVTITENVIFDDYVATDGWWQVMAQDSVYVVSLSNGNEITQVPGTYTVADLDPEYSYIGIIATKTKIDLKSGSIEVKATTDGYTFEGSVMGSDSMQYNLKIVYKRPKAETTVNVSIPNAHYYGGYAAYGLHAVYGTGNGVYVQLGIWSEGEVLQGNFTEDDLDNEYIGSGITLSGDINVSIYSAAISVTPGNGEGVYAISADLLGYNNTLYKVTMNTTMEASGAPAKKLAKKHIRVAHK